MSSSPFIFDVVEAEFEAKVLQKSREVPVIVDFWAPWCGPCRALSPLLEKAIEKLNGEVLLAKVNTDAEQRLAMYFRIEGLPTVIAFKNGKPVDEFVGLLSEAAIGDFLKRVGPSESDKQSQAAAAIAESDPVAAEKAFRDSLAKDPNQEAAALGLARLLIDQNRDAEAAEVLESSSATGEEVDRLNAIVGLKAKIATPGDWNSHVLSAIRNALDGKHGEALAQLLTIGEGDSKLAMTQVKEAMVGIFALAGPQSPLANEYRSKLASLLY